MTASGTSGHVSSAPSIWDHWAAVVKSLSAKAWEGNLPLRVHETVEA
jgi:hypothetical protein